MEINIISRETIKPSLPTPKYLKTHTICLFDMVQLNTYFPLILFYHNKNKNANDTFSSQLKKSLSEALTICYPLAGRRSGPFSITCNDEGAIYIEANVSINMTDFLNPPKLDHINKLLPCEPNITHPPHEVLPQLLIQFNNFKCGGIAIGLCCLHTLLDACSCSSFLRIWSSICKGSSSSSSPDFSSAPSLFPPRNTLGARSGVLNLGRDTKIEAMCTTTRFLFDSKSINKLKAKAKEEGGGNNTKVVTRYQVVSSFICKHMIVSYLEESNNCDKIQVVVLHVVDMRRRMGEPFSQDTIGNLLWPAVMLLEGVNKGTEIGELVRISGHEIGKVNEELFVKVQNDAGFMESDEFGEMMLEGLEKKDPISFVFTSWANMGFNELDFGVGKPLWAALRGGTKEAIPNTVVLMETSDGGIEAWVTMAHKHLAILENDVHFLRYALHNPTVSTI